MQRRPLNLEEILENIQKYNGKDLCQNLFGFLPEERFDGLVIAPGWKAGIVVTDPAFSIIKTAQHSYISAYTLKKDGYKFAWIQCAAGQINLIDSLLICAELNFDSLFFVGAVGAIDKSIEIGELCTPSSVTSFGDWTAFASHKLTAMPTVQVIRQDPRHIRELGQAASVYPEYPLRVEPLFCSGSIALEYSHIEEIRKTGSKLIELETFAFLEYAEQFHVPSYILLAVSDNTETKDALLTSRSGHRKYSKCRGEIIPNLIVELTKQQKNR